MNLSWTSAITISGPGINYDPTISTNNQGNGVVVWTNGTYPDLAIHSSFYDGSSWSPFTTISDTATSLTPVCGMDQDGNAVAIWKSIDEKGQSIIAAQKKAGADWSLPTSIAISPLNTSLSIAVNPYGETIAGWINNEANLIEIANLKIGGYWGEINAISLPGENSANLILQIDISGNGIAIWNESETGAIFRSQTINDYTSVWSDPVALTSSGNNTDLNFNLAQNGNGVASWIDVETYDLMASIYENGKWGVATVLSNDCTNCLMATTLGPNYFVSWSESLFGHIMGCKNISSIWEYPIKLSTSAGDPTTYNPSANYTGWVDPLSSEIYVAEYPESGDPLPPFIISDGYYNLPPKTSSSDNMVVFTWESIVSDDHLIKVNMDY